MNDLDFKARAAELFDEEPPLRVDPARAVVFGRKVLLRRRTWTASAVLAVTAGAVTAGVLMPGWASPRETVQVGDPGPSPSAVAGTHSDRAKAVEQAIRAVLAPPLTVIRAQVSEPDGGPTSGATLVSVDVADSRLSRAVVAVRLVRGPEARTPPTCEQPCREVPLTGGVGTALVRTTSTYAGVDGVEGIEVFVLRGTAGYVQVAAYGGTRDSTGQRQPGTIAAPLDELQVLSLARTVLPLL